MRIERIPVEVRTRAPTGRTAAYLVGESERLLVDPAAADVRIDADLDTIEHIAVTHHHADHIGAVESYAKRTDATVWCRYGREDSFAEATGIEADRTFREGTVIPAGTESMTVHETPGHAAEHVAFDTEDGLLVGDLAVAEGSVVVGAPAGDMRAYLTSLRRVYAMNPDRLYPSHGPVIENPRGTCKRLIEHRLDRESRVLKAVTEDNRTVDTILDSAYEKELSGVRDLAGMTVRAHLEKLHYEGRIQWDGAQAEPSSRVEK